MNNSRFSDAPAEWLARKWYRSVTGPPSSKVDDSACRDAEETIYYRGRLACRRDDIAIKIPTDKFYSTLRRENASPPRLIDVHENSRDESTVLWRRVWRLLLGVCALDGQATSLFTNKPATQRVFLFLARKVPRDKVFLFKFTERNWHFGRVRLKVRRFKLLLLLWDRQIAQLSAPTTIYQATLQEILRRIVVMKDLRDFHVFSWCLESNYW